ncbi:MAG: helix-turn-helix domain-containing protein [Acidobacteria bacterium]|nr:helix-turn-helix domain-containing protein [Acidobacteriota bacterium]
MRPTPAGSNINNPNPAQPEILTVRQVAELLGISEKAARCRVSQGLLPFRRWGGSLVFLRKEILAFLEALPGTSLKDATENAERRIE